MKSLLKRVLCGMLIASIFMVSVSAEDNVIVELDGKRVSFSDQQPVIKDGRTLVPVRGVFEQLGYNINWDDTTQTATLSNSVNTVVIKRWQSTFTTNGKTYNLDVPAQTINDRMMIPFRAVLESVNCGVDWDGNSKKIVVSLDGSNSALPNGKPLPFMNQTYSFKHTGDSGWWGTITWTVNSLVFTRYDIPKDSDKTMRVYYTVDGKLEHIYEGLNPYTDSSAYVYTAFDCYDASGKKIETVTSDILNSTKFSTDKISENVTRMTQHTETKEYYIDIPIDTVRIEVRPNTPTTQANTPDISIVGNWIYREGEISEIFTFFADSSYVWKYERNPKYTNIDTTLGITTTIRKGKYSLTEKGSETRYGIMFSDISSNEYYNYEFIMTDPNTKYLTQGSRITLNDGKSITIGDSDVNFRTYVATKERADEPLPASIVATKTTPAPNITTTSNNSNISNSDLEGAWVSADSIGIVIFNFSDNLLVITFGDGKEDPRSLYGRYEIDGGKVIFTNLENGNKTAYDVSLSDNRNTLYIDGVSFKKES